MARAWRGLLSAIAFLTVVPVPAGPGGSDEEGFAVMVAWLPLVGGAVGAAAGSVRVACDPLLGREASTALAIAALVLVTGALHQDGLADCFDGLGVRGDRTRRLEVMRDSAVGAFGVLALIFWALIMLTALDQLEAVRALRALVGAGALARLAVLVHARATPPARLDGLGASLRVTWPSLVWGAVSTVVLVALVAGPARAALALGVCVVISGLGTRLARRAVGGRTGDTLGAVAAVTEAVVCLALSGAWR